MVLYNVIKQMFHFQCIIHVLFRILFQYHLETLQACIPLYMIHLYDNKLKSFLKGTCWSMMLLKNKFGLVYRIVFCETHYLVVFIQMISNFVLANIYSFFLNICFCMFQLSWNIFWMENSQIQLNGSCVSFRKMYVQNLGAWYVPHVS